jgi:hypothetical protein
MSRHRAILVALATLFTAGTTSAALACCEWGNPAPLAYQWSGCGGCGPAMAPVTYAEPVFAGGCGGCGAPLATYAQPAVGWGGGCGCSGCGGCGGGYATPAIEPTPIAPSPIYVVNQGPDYTGPASWSRIASMDRAQAMRRLRRIPTLPVSRIPRAMG